MPFAVPRLGDGLGAAQALSQLGNLLSAGGEPEQARELHEESLALREAADDARGIGLSLLAIAVAAARAARVPAARGPSAERALSLFDRTDDGPGRASAVMQLRVSGRRRQAGYRRPGSSRSGRSACGGSSFLAPPGAPPSCSSWRSSTPRSASPSVHLGGFARPRRSSPESVITSAWRTAEQALRA